MRYYPPRFLFRRYEIVKRLKSGYNFLEIGPGSLNLTADILKHYANGTLVEFNPYVQEVYNDLERPTRKRLHLVIEDFMLLTGDSTYDCIIACEVMEHIEQDLEFLRKVHSLLNNQGELVISVPSRQHFWSIHDSIVGHVRRYEKQDVIKMLSKEGFRNIDVISYGFPFVNILRWPRILLAKVQARRKGLWNKTMQTQESGLSPCREIPNIFGILCNKYTVYPLCVISSLFNRRDLSDGYIVTAEK
ncbi:MAG: class I SAM-dependent methyltransferase [Syntrophales bacterium]|nr:class I SAM-dependent methyltransferase [Syntrophales bacterium]